MDSYLQLGEHELCYASDQEHAEFPFSLWRGDEKLEAFTTAEVMKFYIEDCRWMTNEFMAKIKAWVKTLEVRCG